MSTDIIHAARAADQNQQRKFGDLLFCIDLCCWVNSLAWSPNGSTLVAAGHDRCIHLLQLPKDPGVPDLLLNLKYCA